MRPLIATLLAIFATAAPSVAADFGPEVDAYLSQVTSTIRSQLSGISVKGKGVATDISFKCWAFGGTPTEVEIPIPGSNAQWDEVVKEKIKKAEFPKFSLGDDDQLNIDARISYFPDSAKPQPQVIYRNVQRLKTGPAWRLGEMIFYGGTYICALVCVVVQTVIILVGVFDIVKRKIGARASKHAQTE